MGSVGELLCVHVGGRELAADVAALSSSYHPSGQLGRCTSCALASTMSPLRRYPRRMTPWRSSAAFVGSFAGHSGALVMGVGDWARECTTAASEPPSGNATASCAEGASPASPAELDGETGDGCPLHPDRASATAPAPAYRHHIIVTGRRPSTPVAQDFCSQRPPSSTLLFHGLPPTAVLHADRAVPCAARHPPRADTARVAQRGQAAQQDLVARGQSLFDDQQYEESIQTLSAAPSSARTTRRRRSSRSTASSRSTTSRSTGRTRPRAPCAVSSPSSPDYALPASESPRFRDFFAAVKKRGRPRGARGS